MFINSSTGTTGYGSNHLYDLSKNWPEGTHLGHVDGHVEWRSGAEMDLRFTVNGAEIYW